MTARMAEPLPECLSCERPTARRVHEATGGLCSDCHTQRLQARR